MDYEQASDFEINMAVAISLGIAVDPQIPKGTPIGDYAWVGRGGQTFSIAPIPDYCNNASDAWSIIVESKIDVINTGDDWTCSSKTDRRFAAQSDKNPLRAAMIVYLKMQEEK